MKIEAFSAFKALLPFPLSFVASEIKEGVAWGRRWYKFAKTCVNLSWLKIIFTRLCP
ncbi:MAG: hypothetical protein ACQEP8_06375 [Chlamydiota bacterium]